MKWSYLRRATTQSAKASCVFCVSRSLFLGERSELPVYGTLSYVALPNDDVLGTVYCDPFQVSRAPFFLAFSFVERFRASFYISVKGNPLRLLRFNYLLTHFPFIW